MIRRLNRYEYKLMRKSGNIASSALKKALDSINVGVSELEIDKIVQDEIFRLGGDLSYKSVPGYKYATCITVNDQVVHGIPTERKFEDGDLVSVDLAVSFKGWHTDCAWSVLVGGRGLEGEKREEKKKFLKVGEEALRDGVSKALDGNRVGDVSNAIQSRVEGAGYSIVRALVGHGVGRSLHEEPEIPGYGVKDKGPILKSGMSLALEVIYTKGSPDVVLSEDGWTYYAADKSWGGLFEMTVVVGKDKAEILTNEEL